MTETREVHLCGECVALAGGDNSVLDNPLDDEEWRKNEELQRLARFEHLTSHVSKGAASMSRPWMCYGCEMVAAGDAFVYEMKEQTKEAKPFDLVAELQAEIKRLEIQVDAAWKMVRERGDQLSELRNQLLQIDLAKLGYVPPEK